MLDRVDKDSIRFRIIILVFIVIISVTAIIVSVSSYIYISYIVDNSNASTLEMQNQVKKTLDLKISEINKSIDILGREEYLLSYLKVNDKIEPAGRVEYETRLRTIIDEYINIYDDYINVVVVSSMGHYLSNTSYRLRRLSLTQESWYKLAEDADGEPVIISSSIGRNISARCGYSANGYISIAKAIKDSVTHKVIGVVLVDLDINSVRELVKDITLASTGFVCVLDSEGRVIYTPDNNIVYRIRPSWFKKGTGGYVTSIINNREYRLIYNHSMYSKLITVGIYDMEMAYQGVAKIRIVAIAVATISSILAMVWSVIVASTITTPIIDLATLMDKAKNGDLSVRFEGKSNGEIAVLGNAFNSMIDRINELIDKVYKNQKDKRNAEIRILREQIKPHFLYNSLSTIQWMVRKYEALDVDDMIYSLSNFYRLSLSRGREYIALEEELSIVKSYLDVQRYRYEELFEYVLDCDESICRIKVPKLILQPLVENALYHGIKESDEAKGHIWINALSSNNDIIIAVEDDGVGMNDAECKALNDILENNTRGDNIKAYGVINVHDRIRLSYGEGYGLMFKSRRCSGVIAQVRLSRNHI